MESVKLSLRRGVVAVPPHGGVNRSRSHELVRSIVMGKGHKKASTSGRPPTLVPGPSMRTRRCAPAPEFRQMPKSDGLFDLTLTHNSQCRTRSHVASNRPSSISTLLLMAVM